MKTLNFDINEQVLAKGNTSGLAVGSENYIECRFHFSEDWAGAVKAAEFDGYPVLLENDACVIPDEVLTRRKFDVRVVGKDGDTKITTNTITIRQGA